MEDFSGFQKEIVAEWLRIYAERHLSAHRGRHNYTTTMQMAKEAGLLTQDEYRLIQRIADDIEHGMT